MFFRIQSTTPDTDLAIYRLKRRARLFLTTYKHNAADLLIDRYLREHFKITLKEACRQILQNLKFSINALDEIIVTVPDPELKKIARIITYGPGTILGSNILKEMLTL